MDVFFVALEKMGMFAIAGYLVWNLVQQQKDSNAMWHDFAKNINDNIQKLVEVLDRLEQDFRK